MEIDKDIVVAQMTSELGMKMFADALLAACKSSGYSTSDYAQVTSLLLGMLGSVVGECQHLVISCDKHRIEGKDTGETIIIIATSASSVDCVRDAVTELMLAVASGPVGPASADKVYTVRYLVTSVRDDNHTTISKEG
jgi:hypothetical protein